jgi:hypothetical protein
MARRAEAQDIRALHSTAGEDSAAAELAGQIPPGGDGFSVLFCTPQYDLARLGAALAHAGHARVIAVTTGRSFAGGQFFSQGVTGFHLPAARFTVVDALIGDAADFGLPQARDVARSLRARLGSAVAENFPHVFGLLMADAEARCEERLTAALGTELAGLPIVGGSVGDAYFDSSAQPGAARLSHCGQARRGAASFCLIACKTPVFTISHTHYVPDPRRRVVITEADPARRLVFEIDGRRAVQAYAKAAGLAHPPRHAGDCALHPLMIRIGGQYFARGVQRVHADGSLEFACAMEPGMVLSLARPGEMVAGLSQMFQQMRAAIGPPELVIGFECAARTVDMEQSGLTAQVASMFRQHRVTGFCALGEQFNTIHVNNSFTCVGFGPGAR